MFIFVIESRNSNGNAAAKKLTITKIDKANAIFIAAAAKEATKIVKIFQRFSKNLHCNFTQLFESIWIFSLKKIINVYCRCCLQKLNLIENAFCLLPSQNCPFEARFLLKEKNGHISLDWMFETVGRGQVKLVKVHIIELTTSFCLSVMSKERLLEIITAKVCKFSINMQNINTDRY